MESEQYCLTVDLERNSGQKQQPMCATLATELPVDHRNKYLMIYGKSTRPDFNTSSHLDASYSIERTTTPASLQVAIVKQD